MESVKHYNLFKTVSCGSRKGVSAPTFMCVLCFVFAYMQHAAVPAPIAHLHFKQQQMQVRMPMCLWVSVWKCTHTHKSEDRKRSTFTFKTSWRGNTCTNSLVMPLESAWRIEVSQSAFIPYQQLDGRRILFHSQTTTTTAFNTLNGRHWYKGPAYTTPGITTSFAL